MATVAGTTHKSRILTDISQEVKVGSMQAERLFPPGRPVDKDSDEFVIYNARDIDTLQGANQDFWPDGGATKQLELRHSTDTFVVQYYGLNDTITLRALDNQDPPIDLQVDAAQHLTGQLLLRREKRMLTVLGTAGNWGSVNLGSGAGWDSTDYATSDPLTDIKTALLTVWKAIGIRPNTIAMDPTGVEELSRHPDILDLVHGTVLSIDEDLLGKILRSKFRMELVVVDAIENSANIAATASRDFMWSDKCWIGYIEQNPGLHSITATKMFRRGFGSDVVPTDRWYDNDVRGWKVRPYMAYTHKVVTAGAGYLIEDIIAP